MIPQRVSLITIGAWDLPKLRTFYKSLGWTETDWSSDNYSVFKTAGGMLSTKILTAAHDAFWGGRSGSFFDPENNYWEIAYNPNSVFDERGAMIEMNG